MIKEVKRKLTLDRSVTYQIKVPGHLDKNWSEWDERMTVTAESEDDGQPVTTLTGPVDQAALLVPIAGFGILKAPSAN